MKVLIALILGPVILDSSQSLSKFTRCSTSCEMLVPSSYRAQKHIYVKNSDNPPSNRGKKKKENLYYISPNYSCWSLILPSKCVKNLYLDLKKVLTINTENLYSSVGSDTFY